MKSAGATVFSWDEEALSSDDPETSFPGLTLVLSEPSVASSSPFRAFVARHRAIAVSYFYITHCLTQVFDLINSVYKHGLTFIIVVSVRDGSSLELQP